MSFYTALSGLQASQKEMSTISHNLANVATDGFKKSRTEFADVIASSVSSNPTSLVGSGVVTKAIRQQFGQGNLIQTGSTLDLAISGDGFFATKPDADGAKMNFTRNGGFLVDPERYVVDGQGGHLQVFPVDGSGAVVASGVDSLVSLRLPQTSGVPTPTGNVALSLNLNSTAAIPATATFDRFDPTSYNQSTQTTVYDAGGNPQTMTSYFVRTSLPSAAEPTSEWQVYSFVSDQPLQTGGADAVTLTFDGAGALTSPTTATTFDPVTPNGATAEQTIALDFGAATTQKATPFVVNSRSQDGAAVGQLESVAVDEQGIVRASFSNGDSLALGKVALANFANPTGLRQQGNGYWASTGLSGDVVLGEANKSGMGGLMSGIIEGSNVDITEELVALIAAQRNFQANAKALDTSSQISQTIFNIRS
ncbi:flagellar hook protein FlgE [Sphingomonas baiyangensis]|uniref:Flagellar hook protein FlgE n=1 Tax=Sphingomonas baiyangensis TaxID=2572576 RepID=A0A4U1L2P2_9SPHN|nr:flagellar hook protein FlgE [Sphingomonas baiyangensis]TKD51157.1 flagellar hook protein FlgE [Sphingomonas baiyangensis]